MITIDSTDHAADDFSEAAQFDYGAQADLFPGRGRQFRGRICRYRRYVRAADAIRFAIEELPPELLGGTYLEVDESRFDGREIRCLYDSVEYPLARMPRPNPNHASPKKGWRSVNVQAQAISRSSRHVSRSRQ